MNRFFLPLSALALAVILMVLTVESVGIFSFISLWPAMISLVLPCLLLLTHYTPKEATGMFTAVMSASAVTQIRLQRCALFFATWQRLAMVSGLLGFTSGIITLLSHLTAPEKMGMGAALSLLSLLYTSLVLLFITIPFSGAVKKRRLAIEEEKTAYENIQ